MGNLAERAGRKLYEGAGDAASWAYHRANMLACGVKTYYTPEQVKVFLERATGVTGKAKSAYAFKDAFGTLSKAEQELQKAVGEIDSKIKEAAHLAAVADAGCRIAGAIETLNEWDPQSNKPNDNEAAAEAFDKLFGGVALFMGCLPFPLSLYKDTFKDIEKYGFFKHMRNKLNSGGSETTGGRVLTEAEKDTGIKLH